MKSGLADELQVDEDTLTAWGKANAEFLGALKAIRQRQKRIVQRKAATNQMNVSLGLRVLSANHNMREKSDVTSDDGPIQGGVIYLPEKKPEGHGA